jgi:hypothetical protein
MNFLTLWQLSNTEKRNPSRTHSKPRHEAAPQEVGCEGEELTGVNPC